MTAIKLHHTWFEKLRHMRSSEHRARLRTVTWMLVDVHRSRSVHLSKIAQKLSGAAQQKSKTRRLSRVLESSAMRVHEWYEPVAKGLLEGVAAHGQPIRLIAPKGTHPPLPICPPGRRVLATHRPVGRAQATGRRPRHFR